MENKFYNKGFTLVELIIVIAIMAILSAAIAPALIRYIVKARKADDIAAADTIATSLNAAIASNEELYEYIDWQTRCCTFENHPNDYRVIAWSAAPSKSSTRSKFTYCRGASNGLGDFSSQKQAFLDFVNEDLGDKVVDMRFNSFTHLDQWIMAVDKDGNLYIFVSANFREGSYWINSERKGGSPSSYCYELWPQVDKKYNALTNANDAN